jgi:hypothetical protein
MQTKREYLISKGLARATRGKFSTIALEEIQRAINAGVKFHDPNAKEVVVKDENGKETTKRLSDVFVVAEPRPDRPVGEYTFKNPDGTKFKRLHTNACVACNYSFRWCLCEDGPTQFQYPHKMGQSDVLARLAGVPTRPVVVPEAPRRRRPRKVAQK